MAGIRAQKLGIILLHLLTTLLLLVRDLEALEITRLSVPRWVKNGTEDHVILDCEYTYSEQDVRLVVKWYLDDDRQPIYQWIPELQARHVSRRLMGRMDMDYSIYPSHRLTKYRALNILRPTTELSGKYMCHVVSWAGQDMAEEVMVVYVPPKTIDFNYTRISPTRSNFTCEVDGIFPLPQVDFLLLPPGESDGERLEDILRTEQFTKNGVWKVQTARELADYEIPGDGTVRVACRIVIPGTDYMRHREIDYFPSTLRAEAEGDGAVSLQQIGRTSMAWFLTIFLMLAFS